MGNQKHGVDSIFSSMSQLHAKQARLLLLSGLGRSDLVWILTTDAVP
jgi:hypothetical protein